MSPDEIDATAQELLICADLLPLRRKALCASADLLAIMKFALMEECLCNEKLFQQMMELGKRDFEDHKRRKRFRVVR